MSLTHNRGIGMSRHHLGYLFRRLVRYRKNPTGIEAGSTGESKRYHPHEWQVYDPQLGRILQAGPFLDGATNTQGFNPHSYVGNNSLSCTGPTGYFKFKDVMKIVGVVAVSVTTYGAASTWAMGEGFATLCLLGQPIAFACVLKTILLQ